MNKRSSNPTTASPHAPQLLPLMLLLFIGSGAAALIYEIVWLQSLSLSRLAHDLSEYAVAGAEGGAAAGAAGGIIRGLMR